MTIEEAKKLKPGDTIIFPHDKVNWIVVEIRENGVLMETDRPHPLYRKPCLHGWDYLEASNGEKICS